MLAKCCLDRASREKTIFRNHKIRLLKSLGKRIGISLVEKFGIKKQHVDVSSQLVSGAWIKSCSRVLRQNALGWKSRCRIGESLAQGWCLIYILYRDFFAKKYRNLKNVIYDDFWRILLENTLQTSFFGLRRAPNHVFLVNECVWSVHGFFFDDCHHFHALNHTNIPWIWWKSAQK